ncbi:MAG: lysylphosphatidylglycerol synthase transmembrane domain-containing protein, partial [Ardenticatenaceae bacterium]
MKEHRTRLVIGSLVSLILLGWVIWSTDWGQVVERLQEADWLMLLAAFVSVMVNITLRAWRWGIMLEPEDGERSFATLFDIVNLGYLANNVLPARLGDLIRVYLAGEWTKVSFS